MAHGPDPRRTPLPEPAGGLLGPHLLVYDLVYNPARTPLLRAAAAAGARTQEGLPMLIYQGALAFERWTGRPAPVELMIEHGRGPWAGSRAGAASSTESEVWATPSGTCSASPPGASRTAAAIGAVVDGCPPRLALSEADIQPDLDRRAPGQSAIVTQRKETDTVRILSGVFEGQRWARPSPC